MGLRLKMPAVVERGRVLLGYLVAVKEDAGGVQLKFSDLEPESLDD